MGIGWRKTRAGDRARVRGERGTAVVEAALAFPVLFSLLVGIITGGSAYNSSITLNNAAREGSRFGATLPVNGNMVGWLTAVIDVSKGAGTGELDSDVDGQYICVAYVHPDGSVPNDRTTQVVEVAGVRTFKVGEACMNDSLASDQRRVQVVTRRDATLEAIFFSRVLHLDASSVSRFERAS